MPSSVDGDKEEEGGGQQRGNGSEEGNPPKILPTISKQEVVSMGQKKAHRINSFSAAGMS